MDTIHRNAGKGPFLTLLDALGLCQEVIKDFESLNTKLDTIVNAIGSVGTGVELDELNRPHFKVKESLLPILMKKTLRPRVAVLLTIKSIRHSSFEKFLGVFKPGVWTSRSAFVFVPPDILDETGKHASDKHPRYIGRYVGRVHYDYWVGFPKKSTN